MFSVCNAHPATTGAFAMDPPLLNICVNFLPQIVSSLPNSFLSRFRVRGLGGSDCRRRRASHGRARHGAAGGSVIGDPVLITPPVAHRGGEAFSLLDPTIHHWTCGLQDHARWARAFRAVASRGIHNFCLCCNRVCNTSSCASVLCRLLVVALA